jgi:hypothetical protein
MRFHVPETGPFSTCMHRADAATVSYTEVVVSSRQAMMRHHAGAPCENTARPLDSIGLSISNPAKMRSHFAGRELTGAALARNSRSVQPPPRDLMS